MIRHFVAATTVAAGLLAATGMAHAGGVSWSVGIATPGVGAVVSNGYDRAYDRADDRAYDRAYSGIYAPVPVYVDAPVYAPAPVYVPRRPVLLAPPLPRHLTGARWIASPAADVIWSGPVRSVRYVASPSVVYRYDSERWEHRRHDHHDGRRGWADERHEHRHGRD